MITLEQFCKGVDDNAKRIKSYVKGQDGRNGTSDCVGLIIGGLRLAGVTYTGIHGSNYFAREWTDNLREVTSETQLRVGDVVYKAYVPGEAKYTLYDRYKKGGKYYNGDLNDYYHIGEVKSLDPLIIQHCSGGGMHYDKKLGNWRYAGEVKGVTGYSGENVPVVEPPKTGTAIVDVPNDGTVNVREKPSTGSVISARLREGEKVTILEDDGTWCRVEYTRTGYIMTRFLAEKGR